MHIGSGIYRVAGADLSSVYDDAAYLVLYEDCAFLVDAGSGHGIDNMLREILYVVDDPGDIGYILSTHAHHRSSGGIYYITRILPHVMVVSHYPDSLYLRKPEKTYNMFIEELGPQMPVYVSIEVYEDRRSLSICGDTIDLIHTPCHTRGSMSVAVSRDGLRYVFVGGLVEDIERRDPECRGSIERVVAERPDVLCHSGGCIYGRENIYRLMGLYET